MFPDELRLFPRSFFVTTTDIFSNNWSDPTYFGKVTPTYSQHTELERCVYFIDAEGYDADLFWDSNGDVCLPNLI